MRLYAIGFGFVLGILSNACGHGPALSGQSSSAGASGGSSAGASGGSSAGASGGSSSGASSGSSSGSTFVPPSEHPYISLAAYDGASTSSPAYLRLKSEADDAAVVTAAHASGTFDALVSALDADHYAYSVADSVVMYHLSGDMTYLQQAMTMVDLLVTSETEKANAGQQPLIANDSYLEVGLYLEQLALTYDYGYTHLSDAQRSAWKAYADQAIYNVWHADTAKWGTTTMTWSAWATNDPGDNYYYSFLKATQLWAIATQNHDTMTFLRAQKYTELTPYFSVLTGGGSREGTGYGSALRSLFEDFAYWKNSTGEDLSSTHTCATLDYWVHATVPTLDYFASIGDQARSSMTYMFDYQRSLVEQAETLCGASTQAGRGVWWLNHIKVTDGGGGTLTGMMRYNFDFRFDLLSAPATEQAPTALVYHATGVGALFARSNWTESASWLATVAGPYDQSHAHQDQGSFAFYKNGWLSATNNLYSLSGLHAEVGAHNVIRFVSGGAAIGQNNALSSMTYADAGNVLDVHQNLTPAYASNATSVSSWTRDLTYTRSSNSLRIHDLCSIGAGIQPVWQLQVPVPPVTQSNGSMVAGGLTLTSAKPVTATFDHMPDVDSDFLDGYRINLTAASGCEFDVTLTAQ